MKSGQREGGDAQRHRHGDSLQLRGQEYRADQVTGCGGRNGQWISARLMTPILLDFRPGGHIFIGCERVVPSMIGTNHCPTVLAEGRRS